MDGAGLMPHIQRTVLSYGDEVIAVQDEESQAIYLPITRMCDNLGVERYRQARRLREHPAHRDNTVLRFYSINV
jgi:hypothetical protein